MTAPLSTLIIGFCICLLVLASLVGNLLVCLAIYTDSRLRRRENLFLASLAVADLLVAVLVMTLAGVNNLMGYWLFGQDLCNTWIAVDIMCSTASIFSLCAISLDRYIHIKYPFQYSSIVTKKAVLTSIVVIWLFSAVISVFSLMFHRSSLQRLYPLETSSIIICTLDLAPLYAVISSTISFCLPCLVMICIYIRLYIYSRRQFRIISKISPSQSPPKVYKHHKAAVTIGVVMGVFMVCWVPFFSANILTAFCETCVSHRAFTVFTWLGYSNSMFNPFIYTALNTEFRDSFIRILTRKLSDQISIPSSQS